jgi:hypothetical protein
VHEFQILTVSSSLPLRLMDDLLTRTESVLQAHGASRVWIDQTRPGLTVVAEFPEVAGSVADVPAGAELSPLV